MLIYILQEEKGCLTSGSSLGADTWRAAVAADIIAWEPLDVLNDGFRQVLQAVLPRALLSTEGHGEGLFFAVCQHWYPPVVRNRRRRHKSLVGHCILLPLQKNLFSCWTGKRDLPIAIQRMENNTQERASEMRGTDERVSINDQGLAWIHRRLRFHGDRI